MFKNDFSSMNLIWIIENQQHQRHDKVVIPFQIKQANAVRHEKRLREMDLIARGTNI